MQFSYDASNIFKINHIFFLRCGFVVVYTLINTRKAKDRFVNGGSTGEQALTYRIAFARLHDGARMGMQCSGHAYRSCGDE